MTKPLSNDGNTYRPSGGGSSNAGGQRQPYAPMNQGPQTLSAAMGKAGTGPPQQLESGSLQYPSGMRTWNTSGGRYDGGTGVSYPNAQGEHLGSNYQFFDRQGNRMNPNQDDMTPKK